MSIRAIAASLVLSPRTIDGHLERILAKTQLRVMDAIAWWVAFHMTRCQPQGSWTGSL
ncbi:LuxR family transcriptional regulator [Rhodococcus sp. WS4]|nr:LuxR family transcriptional regulator [Rhodococcus sp. WS4]